MKAIRAFFPLTTTLVISTWLVFSGTTFIGSAQTPSSGLTVENFFNAVHGNDTNTVSKMLEANTNLVHAIYYGRLPITMAAGDGSIQIVALLLKQGADVNVQNDTWNTSNMRLTALEAAIWSGNTNLCKLLLEAGANPDLQSGSGESALHYAFSYHRTEMVEWLLDYGADAFLPKGGYGRATPFELAITQGNGKLVPRMLGQEGAGPAALKPARPLPWKKTAAENRVAAAKIIAEHGTALLSAAAQRGELEAVEALLKAGVSARTNAPGELPVLQAFAISEAAAVKSRPSAIAQWQQTSNTLKNFGPNANPEFTASIRSQEAEQAAKVASLAPEHLMQIRDLLIKNGADYDAFAATALGDTNQAKKLLSADNRVVQARDRNGQTPLHWSVLNDQLPLTEFWLQAGVSPATTNSAGQTALHLAAAKGLVEHVKVLLATHAPTGILDTNGWTPLDAAIHAQQTETIRLLLNDKTVPPRSERAVAISVHEAAASGNLSALAALAETTNNLEARNELGLTPLQVAVTKGHLAAAALLVDKGADVNVRDPDGNTMLLQVIPRFFGFYVSDRPSTNWLAARLAQNPHKDEYLKYLTVGQNEQGPGAILQTASFLLACGIDVTATNHAGQTAIQLATDEKIALFDDREPLLKLLGSGGGNVNETDMEGNTALHRAAVAYADNLGEQVPALIASGADINATNFQGRTPLHVAVEKIGMWPSNPGGPNNAILSLIAAKANVNAQDNEGMTPLHVLALADTSFRKEATRALLDAGANSNLRDKQGRTPGDLFLSGKWPWTEAGECIDMLVAAGADLSAKDDQGKTPLHYLAALGSQSPMFFIRGIGDTFTLAKVDINARDNDGDTPLQLAAKTGTRDVFDWLVKHGASLDATNNLGETPRALAAGNTTAFSRFGPPNSETDIFEAVRQGQIENLTKLTKADPKLVNITNQFGQTVLQSAASMGKTNVVEFLIQHGAMWDAVSAVIAGRADVLRDILNQSPQSITNEYGGIPLLNLATVYNHPDVAEILFSRGTNLVFQNFDGVSPLGLALSQQHTNMANLLMAHGAVENIFDATLLGHIDRVKTLIAGNKLLVAATNETRTPLTSFAVAYGKAEILKLLLDNGASLDSPTGVTLLHVAAFYNQSNVVPLLIRHGAKVDAFDTNGFAPLHLATIRGSSVVAAQLLKNNANPNLPITLSENQPLQPAMPMMRAGTFAGNTALHLAALTAQTNMIELLLQSGASVNAANSTGMTPLDMVGRRDLASGLFWIQRGLSPRLPQSSPIRPSMSPVATQAAISLLEKAGGKHGERRGMSGMMNLSPANTAPVLQTGADYHTQGCIDYNARRFTNALADFRKSCELGSDNQDYSYFRIWLIRARLGEKEAATQELAAYLERRKAQKPDDWPSKVGRFLAGQLSESDFLKAADDPSPQTAKEQHCEAYFYVGSKHLIENDKMAAVDYFKKCLTTNVTDFEEYTSAATELLFLQMPPTNP